VRRLLVTASVVPSSLILDTLIKEALSSTETSVVTRVTRRNIPEDTILHVCILFGSANRCVTPILGLSLNFWPLEPRAQLPSHRWCDSSSQYGSRLLSATSHVGQPETSVGRAGNEV
jgi:hypothetical protein